jgi:Protein of unknown function (DUF3604)
MEGGARSVNRHWAQLLLRTGPHVPVAPFVDADPLTDGQVTVTPPAGVAGAFGTWTVTYEVGATPIDELGGLRVQLPEEWHAGIRNSAFRAQASQPREPGFIRGRCSRADVELQTVVELESDLSLDKTGRVSNLSGRAGYYDYVSRVIVRRGRLTAGDVLEIVFGEIDGGSPGFQAGVLASRPLPVLVAVDTGGFGRFRLHADRPTLTLRPELPAELLLTARSDAILGESVPLKLALVDRWANAAVGASAEFVFEVVAGAADVVGRASLAEGQGWLEVGCVPTSAEILRIRATDMMSGLTAVTNPIRVHAQRPARQIYWGDIHSHTQLSADGLGSGEDAYGYARHVSGLDFLSRTDHASYFETGSAIADFEGCADLADAHDDPGEFATIQGYEVSFDSPYGHHNVYFRGRPTFPGDEYTLTLPELWKALRGQDALTIPHHTLKMPAVVDWTGTHDPDLRRNFEIYSAHGLSEAFDPSHPLAVEQSLFTNASTTQRRGTSAQRAWEDGLRLSTLASSDDHRAHPGMPHQGVIAVRADSLSRTDIFDGMRTRRTYATTGARILLDFSVDGIQMGGEGQAPRPLSIRTEVVGTDIIDSVDVLRHTVGRPGFEVIAAQRPNVDAVTWGFDDDPGPGAAIYYVRLRQRGLVRGVLAMAWSSPVWISAVGPS